MSRGEAGGSKAISLDQLIALNDEMAALLRAGVPLEQGLLELGEDMPGRLGELATSIGARLSAGESLPQILASDERKFPPVWRAVVEAGARSGNLAAAMEGMATTARRVSELRRAVGVAMIYPLIVLVLAYGLFIFTLTKLAPVMNRAYEGLTFSSDPLLSWMVWLGDNVLVWAIWPPLVIFLLWMLWRRRSRRGAWTSHQGRASGSIGLGSWRWPTVGRSVQDGRIATFAQMLSLLIEHQAPLHEAIVLAADASGDRALGRAAREVAKQLESGKISPSRETIPAPFPPFLGWLIASGAQPSGLSKTLNLMADNYRQRAARSAAWTVVYLPIVLTAMVGGTAVFIQALAVFAPLIRLLFRLGQPF